MPDHPTQMRRETEGIPLAVARLRDEGAEATRTVAAEIAMRDPRVLISVARGSSDHACTFLKYASELLLGLPMASVGPSVASIYGSELKAAGGMCLALSQSGRNPDIVELARSLRRGNGYAVADQFAAKGARVFVTSDKAHGAGRLEHLRKQHWLSDPIPLIGSFYAMVEQVAARRGIDPDAPRHLKKVTETL